MTWGVCDRGREAQWPLMPPRAIADVLHPTIGHSLHQACTNTNRQSGCTSKPTRRLHLAKPVPFPEYAHSSVLLAKPSNRGESGTMSARVNARSESCKAAWIGQVPGRNLSKRERAAD